MILMAHQMMLTHALMSSIVRHAAHRSPSGANTNSRVTSPGFLSAHQSQQIVADSFSPLTSSLCPSTSIVNPNLCPYMLGSFSPRARRGMSELSALVDPSQYLLSSSSTRADMQAESETSMSMSMWSQSVACRHADDEYFSKVSSPDFPLQSKTASTVTNVGQIATPVLSASSSLVTHDGTGAYDGAEVSDDVTEVSDPFDYSDFSTSSRLTLPRSATASHVPSYLSRLAWFDAPPRPRSVGEQSNLLASMPPATPPANGRLMEGLRWSQSELPLGSSGSSVVATDEYDETESRVMRVNFDDEPTTMPRPVAQTLSVTQLVLVYRLIICSSHLSMFYLDLYSIRNLTQLLCKLARCDPCRMYYRTDPTVGFDKTLTVPCLRRIEHTASPYTTL